MSEIKIAQRPSTLRSLPFAMFGVPVSKFRKYKSSVTPGPGHYEWTKSSSKKIFTIPKYEPKKFVYRPEIPSPAHYKPVPVLSRRPQALVVSRKNEAKGHWWRPTPGSDVYGHAMPSELRRYPVATIGNAKRVTGAGAPTSAPPVVGPGTYETSWGVGEGRSFGPSF